MSRIIYKPTCSNCGEVIHGEVSSKYWRDGIACGREITPAVCLKCGAYFESIVMPYPKNENFEIDMDKYGGGQHES